MLCCLQRWCSLRRPTSKAKAIVLELMIRLRYRRVVALLTISLVWRWGIASPPQDIVGGASAFQGQDIMGGAAVIFKRPQRVRDLVGGARMAIIKKSRPRRPEATETARNTPPNSRQPRGKPVGTETPGAKLSDADRAEAFKDQGNTYYGLGDYPKAIEAYLNALKLTPNDADLNNNLGAPYLNLG